MKGSKENKRKIEEVQNLLKKQKVQAATLLLNELLNERPDDPKVLVLIGIAALKQKDYSQAESFLLQALQKNKNLSEAHFHLASLYLQLEEYDKAIEQYQEVSQFDASHLQAMINLGLAFENKWRFQEAQFVYQSILQEEPENAMVILHLGEVLIKLGNIQEAINIFQKGLEVEPKSADFLNHLGVAFLTLKEKAKAIKCFQKVLALKPDNVQALYNLTLCDPNTLGQNVEVKKLQQFLDSDNLASHDRILCHFALAKIYEHSGHNERTFFHYKAGNDLCAKHHYFDENGFVQTVNQIMEIFDQGLIQEKMIVPIEGKSPLFIVGMPGSGKNLVEKLLIRHSKITCTSPQKLFQDLSRKCLDFPEGITSATSNQLQQMASQYIEELGKIALSDAHIICDSAADNYLYLGLMSILFPKSKIIHCTRHPMDLCLTNYFHSYPHDSSFAHNLGSLGRYYEQYVKLMGYWQSIGIENRIEVKFEDLVLSPHETLKQLFEDLEMSVDVNKIKLSTLYTLEVDRWKKFEPFLQPLIEVLYHV